MSLRTSLQKLIRRDPAASLRERAASLQTDLARVIRQPVAEAAEPETAPDPRDAELLALQPEWEARATAFNRAIEEQGTVTDNAPSVETPPSREPFEDWVRLIPGWRERTGVDAAEAATAEAMGDLCEIENRISNMPAATLAGLKLKARVAQRNEEVSWPEGLEESLVRDILAISEPEISADAEILRLGAQFEMARRRESVANEACNEAELEADRHMPERPARLFFRASDERLNVYRNLVLPEYLEKRKVHSEDVERLRRIMPMTHEVLRPIRPGERAHIDHPGRKFDIVPHSEAQARAEEIVSVWDSWCAAKATIATQHQQPELDAAAEAAGDATIAIAHRIAAQPAQTAAGFRVKIRALAHYNSSFFWTSLPDLPDPDQTLAYSLWRDVQEEPLPAADPTDWNSPPLGFMAYPADDPQGFVIVREGLRLELERLHRIALAEYARKVEPDATEATRARVRRELRLPLFEAASPNGDAEILALGLDLDAAYARWRAATPAYWASQERIRQACEIAKVSGGSIHAASDAAWEAPGVRAGTNTFEDIGTELERISKAIWRTPARTPLGVAVKARATLVMVFLSGEYERDSHLGGDEDLTEQAVRALIEACCALAGVDWKGQPVGADEPATNAQQSEFEADCVWAKAQAAAVDLSGLTILQLHNLFDRVAAAADTWLSTSAEPWLKQDSDSPYRDPNAAGRLVDREQNRTAWIRERVVEKLRGRTPATEAERDYRLETLIRHEIMCNSNLRHAPELRAEIAKAWGG